MRSRAASDPRQKEDRQDNARLILTWLNEDETIEGDSGWVPIEFEALPGLNAAGRHVFRGKPTAFYFQHLPAGNYRFQLGLFQPEGTQPENPFYGRVAIDRLVALDEFEWDQRQRVTEVQRFQNPSGTNVALAPVDGLPTNLQAEYTVLYQYDALDNLLTRRKIDSDPGDGIDPDVVTHFVRDGGRAALEFDGAGQIVNVAIHSPDDGRLLFVIATEHDGPQAGEHVLWSLDDFRGWVTQVHEGGAGLGQIVYAKNGVPAFGFMGDWSAAHISSLRDGMDYDLYSQLYFDAGQAFDVFSARYATEHFAGALASGGGSPYSFRGHPGTGENGSDSHNHAGSSDLSSWAAFTESFGYYVNPANDFQEGGWGYVTGTTKIAGWGMIVVGTAGIGAYLGAPVVGTTLAVSGSVVGVGSGAAVTYAANPNATIPEYGANMSMGGFFGGLSPAGAFGSVGGGFGAAGVTYAAGGNSQQMRDAYLAGDLAGGLVGAGADDAVRLAGRGLPWRHAISHAGRQTAVTGGFAAGGFGAGYYASGGA